MSSMQSAPATIPAMSARSFAAALTLPFAAIWTRSASSVPNSHRAASANTAASPARAVRHLTELTAGLHERGVDLVVLHQGIDTSTSAGRFLFHVLAAQDEMLADLISEATLEGLAAARARGRVGGRPSVMTPAKLRIAQHMLDGGNTITEIAATIGVGRGTLYRHLGDRALTGASGRGGM